MDKLRKTDSTLDRGLKSSGEQQGKPTVPLNDASSANLSEEWQLAAIGADRSSFMRCGGGNLCNETK